MKLKLQGRNSYYFALITLESAIRSYEKKMLKANNMNITPLMLSYIVMIAENKDITSKEIQEILGVSKGTLSNMVKILVQKKYILKRNNQVDKRKYNLTITAQGKKAVALSDEIRLKFKTNIRKYLGGEKLESVLDAVFAL